MGNQPKMTATHLYGAVGEGSCDALQKMGVPLETMNGLSRLSEATGVSWSNIIQLGFQYFKDHGIQIFSVILDILQTLQASGFSVASIETLAAKDGGAFKAVIAAILTAAGKPVPSFLS